ncbi:MAG TPA: hypothetical protein VGK32_14930, partial [Vicinamibacterales bacterium]
MLEPKRRPDPERLLRQITAGERDAERGRLKIYLGYGLGSEPAVRMFDEGRRRHERGQDVAVGAMRSDASSHLWSLVADIPVVPCVRRSGGEAMDVEALLTRQPRVCLVDGVGQRNPEGSRHAARWQDVEDLLAAGTTVIGTIDVQHIDELRKQVEAITGRDSGDGVPLSFVEAADGIVVVDVPPETVSRREGDAALRELALVLAAEMVDRQLNAYLEAQGLPPARGARERLLVCVTPRANARLMIDTARRTADRFHGELIVLHVRQPNLSPADQAALDGHLARAADAGATVAVV